MGKLPETNTPPDGDTDSTGREPDQDVDDTDSTTSTHESDNSDENSDDNDDSDDSHSSDDDNWDPERARRRIERVNRENKKLRKRVNEAPKPEDVAAKDERLKELEPENLRLRVGYELGLPIHLADRLQGDTREEMIEDAEKLLELVAPAKRPATRTPTETPRGGSDPAQEPEETDLGKIGARMFRR